MANEKRIVLVVDEHREISDAYVRRLVREEIGDVDIVRWSVYTPTLPEFRGTGWVLPEKTVHVVYTTKEEL